MIKKKISNKSDPFEPISMCVRVRVSERERERDRNKEERESWHRNTKIKTYMDESEEQSIRLWRGWRAKYTCVEEKKIGKKKRKKRVWRKTRKEIKRKIK